MFPRQFGRCSIVQCVDQINKGLLYPISTPSYSTELFRTLIHPYINLRFLVYVTIVTWYSIEHVKRA